MKLADIKATNWTLSLKGDGSVVEGLAEISQSIFVILTTVKGSDPLRPTFGCDIYKYIDRPINEAIPKMVKSIYDSLTIWEPRVTLKKVSYNFDVDGLVEFTIEWTETTTQQTSSTKVLINGTN